MYVYVCVGDSEANGGWTAWPEARAVLKGDLVNVSGNSRLYERCRVKRVGVPQRIEQTATAALDVQRAGLHMDEPTGLQDCDAAQLARFTAVPSLGVLPLASLSRV